MSARGIIQSIRSTALVYGRINAPQPLRPAEKLQIAADRAAGACLAYPAYSRDWQALASFSDACQAMQAALVIGMVQEVEQ